MVAYSFMKQFAPPIVEGTKRQTIRGERKRHARPGETIQLYTGMRTKYCRRIGVAICRLASPITIDFQEPRISYTLDACLITVWPGKLDEFARGDGFADWPAMCAFWAKYHPELPVFAGWMIRWGEFHQSLDGGEAILF